MQITALAVACCALVIGAVGQATPAADCAAYLSAPLPSEAERIAVPRVAPACASYRSYRGIGRAVNYRDARACAWQERLAQKAGLSQNQKEPTAWVVGGSLILADIYFNGAGVKRNVPLAMRFACETEEQSAQLALPDMLKADALKPFEFCDYAATTFMGNFCAEYASEISDDRRSRYYGSLKASMAPEQKMAFEKLLAAQRAYVEAHGFEVDQGGSIHVMRAIGSAEILTDLFRTEIVHFERGKWPVLSDSQIKSADSLLRREYQKKLQQLAAHTKEEIDGGAVTADDLSKVQAAWETYRDAWDVFARLRYPAAAAAIQAQIALDRYRLLKTIS
jgi:uncharacterized protein YecT (DUF1311 family)